MTATHTPGPWSVRLTKKSRARIDACNWGEFAKVVIRMDGEQKLHEEGVANARLIAAAPDLLAALEAVDEFWAGGDAPPELTAQMRTAIAKARGA